MSECLCNCTGTVIPVLTKRRRLCPQRDLATADVSMPMTICDHYFTYSQSNISNISIHIFYVHKSAGLLPANDSIQWLHG